MKRVDFERQGRETVNLPILFTMFVIPRLRLQFPCFPFVFRCFCLLSFSFSLFSRFVCAKAEGVGL